MAEQTPPHVVIEINPPSAELRNWCRAHGVDYRPVFTGQETHDEIPTDTAG